MAIEGFASTGERAGFFAVLERFPQQKAALQRLFRESPSFRSLCGDYKDCLGGLKSWQQSTATEASDMRGAYADLLQELEQEVRQYLEGEAAAESL